MSEFRVLLVLADGPGPDARCEELGMLVLTDEMLAAIEEDLQLLHPGRLVDGQGLLGWGLSTRMLLHAFFPEPSDD